MSAPDHAPEQVVVARISGAFGVLGWIRVVSFTEPRENILDYVPWYVAEGSGWRKLSVGEIKVHGEGFIAKLRDVTSRDQAQALSGRLIAVPRDQLPALDETTEFYWRDLVGLEVFDTAGQHLGRVDHLLATGAHDVLVIKQGDNTCLIPFLERYVPEVDLAAGKLLVDWQDPA